MEKSKSRTSRGIRKKITNIVIPKNFNLDDKVQKFKKAYDKYSIVYLSNLLERKDVCIFEIPIYISVNFEDITEDKIFLNVKSFDKYYTKESTYQSVNIIENFSKYNHQSFYENCNHNYVIFPVWTDYYLNLNLTSSHASCVIFDISKQKGFYYNPSIGPIDEEKNICKKLEKLIAYSYYGTVTKSNKIHISPLYVPETPQTITNDRNCVFWTFLFIDIYVHFLTEGFNYKPEYVVKILLEKYNTKEKLLNLIDQFKYYLLETNI